MMGLLSSPSQPLPPTVLAEKAAQGRQPSGADLRAKLESKPRHLLVVNVDDKDKLIAYFEVSKKRVSVFVHVRCCLFPLCALVTIKNWVSQKMFLHVHVQDHG